MNEPRLPRYRWGTEVRATVDLYNDGSLADIPEDLLVIAAGGPGEIVQVGHHADANVPLYMVDFGLVVLGCLEEEIQPLNGEDLGPVPGRMEAMS
ncbi:MAG: nitrogen fixation protein NifZ [Rubrivivax sp.]|nr:nitrogen fixation protein NifZ [Rubrivivax sp.]